MQWRVPRPRACRRPSVSRSSSKIAPAAISRSAPPPSIASPPDGYTLLLGLDGPIAINPSLYPKLPYNPFTDLVPISGLAKADQVVIAHPSVPAKDIGELLALAKQKPGEITFAAFGLGSTTHLYMEMLQSMAGVKFQAVQYKGAAPMVADVVAGHVNVTSVSLGQSLPLHNDGKVKILGVATKERLASLPRHPDHRRKRAGVRGEGVVRAVCAGRHAGRHRRKAQRRTAGDGRGCGIPREGTRPLSDDADHEFAGGLQGLRRKTRPRCGRRSSTSASCRSIETRSVTWNSAVRPSAGPRNDHAA